MSGGLEKLPQRDRRIIRAGSALLAVVVAVIFALTDLSSVSRLAIVLASAFVAVGLVYIVFIRPYVETERPEH